jgi:hypothetical protein
LSLAEASWQFFWILYAICLVVFPIAVIRSWTESLREHRPLWELVAVGVFYLGFLGGFFLMIAVVDPWSGATLSWYETAMDMLQAHQCSIAAVARTYMRVQHMQDSLQLIAVSNIVLALVAQLALILSRNRLRV